MKIIVCIKPVPANDGSITINREMDWIHENDVAFEVNEADACALEEALQMREKLGGEVIAVSLGSERAVKCLKDALAKGADSALHVTQQDAHLLSPFALAKLIGAALQAEAPDLVMCGMQSSDRGNGQLAPNLAQELGFAHATMVVGVTADADAKGMLIKRELEGGRAQNLRVSLPCVLGIQSGINKPRYANMKGIMAAKKKPLRVLEPAAAPASLLSPMSLYVPQVTKTAQVLHGSVSEMVGELAQILARRKG